MKKIIILSITLIFLAFSISPVSAETDLSEINMTGMNYIGLYNLAVDLASAGEYDAALEAIDASLAKDETFALGYSAKAGILNAMGEYDKALTAAETATELRPDQAEGWINMGNALLMLGRYEESVEASDKAIELDPEYIEAYINKGTALGYLGRYEEELEVSEEALKMDPYDNRAWANKRYAQKMMAGGQNPQGTPLTPVILVIALGAAFLIAKRD
ncbi:MAG: tetratricopeptide repeat protein [Methanomicrobiaceae archaeon]|nr:tetratricopeptide repeat protein [Methanomicrobiaceae archaeon]